MGGSTLVSCSPLRQGFREGGMRLNISKAVMGASLALLLCGLGTSARADAIPYPTPGVVNPDVYTFKASATGDVVAYFAGSSANNESVLGMLVNCLSTGITGLDNLAPL